MATKLLNKYCLFKQLILASALASLLYCLIFYIKFLQGIPQIMLYLGIPIMPILYLYKPHNLRVFLKCFLSCTLSAFLIGGMTFSIYSFFYSPSAKPSILLPLLIGGILCTGLSFAFNWVRKRLLLPYFEYSLILIQGAKQRQIEGILDTGNCLYTVKHQLPVILIPYDTIETFLEPWEKEMFFECKNCKTLETMMQCMEKYELHDLKKYYLIPFESVGSRESILIGIKWNNLIVKRGNYEKVCKSCVLGITWEVFFKDQAYRALLHPDYILSA
jgi:stage II sporulation protein GA (sporulation sigma-E factor processing peptidase)